MERIRTFPSTPKEIEAKNIAASTYLRRLSTTRSLPPMTVSRTPSAGTNPLQLTRSLDDLLQPAPTRPDLLEPPPERRDLLEPAPVRRDVLRGPPKLNGSTPDPNYVLPPDPRFKVPPVQKIHQPDRSGIQNTIGAIKKKIDSFQPRTGLDGNPQYKDSEKQYLLNAADQLIKCLHSWQAMSSRDPADKVADKLDLMYQRVLRHQTPAGFRMLVEAMNIAITTPVRW
jgi:hypothetical protein